MRHIFLIGGPVGFYAFEIFPSDSKLVPLNGGNMFATLYDFQNWAFDNNIDKFAFLHEG
jgi:hypothetical protein